MSCCGCGGVVMDRYLIRTVRIARKAEISRSRRQPQTQPPTDIIREMVKVDSEGKAEGVLIDSLPWWGSRILRRTQGGP